MGHCINDFFFFNDTATTEIYTLSLHDALPISTPLPVIRIPVASATAVTTLSVMAARTSATSAYRSEEHTSELQSRQYLVCRLLLEKKKKDNHLLPFAYALQLRINSALRSIDYA